MSLAVVHTVDEDRGKIVLLALGVGNPATVGTPGIIVDGVADGGVDLLALAAVRTDEPQIQGRVAEQEVLAVGRPVDLDAVDIGPLGELLLLALAVGAAQVDLVLAAPIAQVSDLLAVGRPDCFAFVDAGGGGQIADVALLGGHGEDVAAGGEDGPLGVGRHIGVGDPAVDGLERRPGQHVVAVDGHGHLAGLFRGQVQEVDPATIFVNDLAVSRITRITRITQAGPLDVVFVVARHLAMLGRPEIVGPDLELAGAVTQIVDRVAVPHGEAVGTDPVGDLLALVGAEIVDPDILGHAALVALPGAVLATHGVVGDARAIGGVAGQAAGGQDHRGG